MEFLATELLEHIFSYLDEDDLHSCSSVCVRWFEIIDSVPLVTVVFDECRLIPDQPPLSIFENPSRIFRSLRLGEIEGNSFSALPQTVTKLHVANSNLSYHEALTQYFPHVVDVHVMYTTEFVPYVYENIKILHIHKLKDAVETFMTFMSCFPNVEKIYIESTGQLTQSILLFILPFKDKVKGLPEFALKRLGTQHCAFRDMDSYNPSRLLVDYRIHQDELVRNEIYLEKVIMYARNKAQYDTLYDTYLRHLPKVFLFVQEPFPIELSNLEFMKVHIADGLLSAEPSLLNCTELEVLAFCERDNASPCFFGHRTLDVLPVKRLTLRLGSKKRCQICWEHLLDSFKLSHFFFHGIGESHIFARIGRQQKTLKSLKIELAPVQQAEPLTYTWTRIPTLRQLTIKYKYGPDLAGLSDILEKQLELVKLDVQGAEGFGDFKGIVDTLIKLKDLERLTLYLHEDLHDLQQLIACKKLKEINFDEEVTRNFNGPPFDNKLMFDNCPLLQKMHYSFRKCATRIWRRLNV